MTFKAIITKRGNEETEFGIRSENAEIQKMGLDVEMNLPQGVLVSGDIQTIKETESKGYRVKILEPASILEIGSYKIDIENESVQIPEKLQIPDALWESWPHHLVQCQGPINSGWIEEIENAGVEIVEAVSNYALFVYGSPKQVNNLAKLSFISWIGPFMPAYRINKNLEEVNGIIKYLGVGIYPSSSVETVKASILQLGGKIFSEHVPGNHNQTDYANLLVESNSDIVPKIACLPTVRWLEFVSSDVTLDGERESQIMARNINDFKPVPGYPFWLSTCGVSGKGVCVAICDSGIDMNANNNTGGHVDIRGRQIIFIDYTDNRFRTDTVGHGTHLAGICLGNANTALKEGTAPADFLWGQGIAPEATYVNQNATMLSKLGRWPPDFGDLTKDAVDNGASIMNNSWATGSGLLYGRGYTSECAYIDKLCRVPSATDPNANLIIVFSAGNNGDKGPCTITTPKEAKNPIVVGSSLTYRPDLHDDGGILDNFKSLDSFSSRGPAKDGRIMPTIVAPGVKVPAAWSQTGVLRGTEWQIVPGTYNNYVFGSGTSQSAAQVSGFCALIVEWWRRNMHAEPSLALVKALLINTAEDMVGNPCRRDGYGKVILLDYIPNHDQGWGLVNLKNIFKYPNSMLTFDQINPFTVTGKVHTFNITAIHPDLPLKVTLVWTDAPGALSVSRALMNDLDLEVEEISTGSIYKGNVFEKGFSKVGGNFDNLNNVECVYIEKPIGQYKVNIIASQLNRDAKPPFEIRLWQDYALVIDNATESKDRKITTS